MLGNSPEEIKTVAKIDHGVDLRTNFLLKYKDGKIADLSSAITLDKSADAFVYGTRGYIYLPKFYGAQEFFINVNGEQRRISAPSIGDGFEEEIIEACECITQGKKQSDILPLAESIAILEIMDRIRAEIGLKYPFD